MKLFFLTTSSFYKNKPDNRIYHSHPSNPVLTAMSDSLNK